MPVATPHAEEPFNILGVPRDVPADSAEYGVPVRHDLVRCVGHERPLPPAGKTLTQKNAPLRRAACATAFARASDMGGET